MENFEKLKYAHGTKIAGIIGIVLSAMPMVSLLFLSLTLGTTLNSIFGFLGLSVSAAELAALVASIKTVMGLVIIVLLLLTIVPLVASILCVSLSSNPEKLGTAKVFCIIAAVLAVLQGSVALFVTLLVCAHQAGKAKEQADFDAYTAQRYQPVYAEVME